MCVLDNTLQLPNDEDITFHRLMLSSSLADPKESLYLKLQHSPTNLLLSGNKTDQRPEVTNTFMANVRVLALIT